MREIPNQRSFIYLFSKLIELLYYGRQILKHLITILKNIKSKEFQCLSSTRNVYTHCDERTNIANALKLVCFKYKKEAKVTIEEWKMKRHRRCLFKITYYFMNQHCIDIDYIEVKKYNPFDRLYGLIANLLYWERGKNQCKKTKYLWIWRKYRKGTYSGFLAKPITSITMPLT